MFSEEMLEERRKALALRAAKKEAKAEASHATNGKHIGAEQESELETAPASTAAETAKTAAETAKLAADTAVIA
ncbi:unnamed protein product, partial [Strongylus vulgaris]